MFIASSRSLLLNGSLSALRASAAHSLVLHWSSDGYYALLLRDLFRLHALGTPSAGGDLHSCRRAAVRRRVGGTYLVKVVGAYHSYVIFFLSAYGDCFRPSRFHEDMSEVDVLYFCFS